MKYVEKLKYLASKKKGSANSERIISEMIYLDAISKYEKGKYDGIIEKAADFLIASIDEEGVVTKDAVKQAESMLSELEPVAKSFTELFIGHAHMDMNWQWSYNETAAMTIDTSRTMLEIMRDDPDFTYGQSQASTYEIIDMHCHEMLDEIKERIREGRWEVTAGEWVECDKNMPDGESLTRQILQSRKYLSGLLDIDPASLNIDFVPDTFGHNVNVPEIDANAGIKYMYHWRGGEENPRIYNFVSPSGKKVLTYREYVCYTGEISTERFEIVPEFAHETGLNTYLCVYGVGDHGGGPTRRDIARIREYMSWPLTPTIRFGTYREFFETVENSGVKIPEVTKELNFLFTGCYTSQARIKMANRYSEARINDAEELSAAASVLTGSKRDPDYLDRSWRDILFSQFHDILPGSGVLETREHALGQLQNILAHVNTYSSASMRKIAAAIDTTSIPFKPDNSAISNGAGVGFAQSVPMKWNYTNTENGSGPVRAAHLFNTTGYERDEMAKIVVWNYEYDYGGVAFYDTEGNELEYCIEKGETDYCFWGHYYCTYLVHVKIPAFGYTTVYMKPVEKADHLSVNAGMYMRGNDTPSYDCPISIENENIKATFDSMTMEVTKLVDKKTGKVLVNSPACYFRLLYESSLRRMTSWVNGQVNKIVNLNREGELRITRFNPSLPYAFVEYSIDYGTTKINCTVSLLKGAKHLNFDVHTYWDAESRDQKYIPQLNFALPVAYETSRKGQYDIPYGILERDALPHDVPALSYLGIGGREKEENVIGIVTDTKYGYRLWNDEGSVDLIRTSFDPDVYCDKGNLIFSIGVMVAPLHEMKEISVKFNHPVESMSATLHEGKLPPTGSAFTVSGNVVTSSVKISESGLGTAFRFYDITGENQRVSIKTASGIRRAYLADSNENFLSELKIKNGSVTVTVPKLDFVTVVTEE